MIESRLWRPAAQRSVRNAWGYIQAQRSSWSSASASALLAATNLVNVYLSHSEIGAMDLGVLHDMDGIKDKARIKLRKQHDTYLQQYLKSYEAMVLSVSEMRDIAASMRVYAKDSGSGPLIEFTKVPMVDGDSGDGGGVAVFATLPLGVFEMLAKEVMIMFEKELKWLLASEFCYLVFSRIEGTSLRGKGDQIQLFNPYKNTHGSTPAAILTENYDKPDGIPSSGNLDCLRKSLSRETFQVYLTALLAEVYINKDRVEEISRLWTEEMMVGQFGSPQR